MMKTIVAVSGVWMDLEYSFSRDKNIPKGMSYPLKRSELDAALATIDVRKIFTVSFSRGVNAVKDVDKKLYVMSVSFGGEAAGGYAGGLFSITLNAVPSECRSRIHDVLVEHLVTVTRWMNRADDVGNVWRSNSHRLLFTFEEGQLTVSEE